MGQWKLRWSSRYDSERSVVAKRWLAGLTMAAVLVGIAVWLSWEGLTNRSWP